MGFRKGPTACRMPVDVNVTTENAATTYQP